MLFCHAIRTAVVSGPNRQQFANLVKMTKLMNMKRSNAEKQQEIAALLKAMPEKANKWIADQLGVSDNTVNTVRKKLEDSGAIPVGLRRVGSDGKARPSTLSGNDAEVYDSIPQWLLDGLDVLESLDSIEWIDRPEFESELDYRCGIRAGFDYDKAALLLPILFLRCKPNTHYEVLFSRLKAVYVIRRAINFKGEEWLSYAWFVWQKDSEGSPTIVDWID